MSKKLNKRRVRNLNYQKLSQIDFSKAGENKTSLPSRNLVPCLEKKQQKKTQHKEQHFTQHNKWMWNFSPRPGHRHVHSKKQLLLTETWRVFFYSLLLFSDLQGLSHQLIAMELNHMAIKSDKCLIFHFLYFQT